MLTDRDRDAAAEKTAEKPSEKGRDGAPMQAEEVLSAQGQAAESYKTDLAKRAEEYALGIDRGTGSQKWLPSSLEIVDGLKKLVGRITRSVVKDSSADTGTESKAEYSQVTRDVQNRPTTIEYPDGKTNRVEYDTEGKPSKVHARDGSTVMREANHWSIAKDGKTSRWDGEIHVSEKGDISCVRLDGRTKVRNVDGTEVMIEAANQPPGVDAADAAVASETEPLDSTKDNDAGGQQFELYRETATDKSLEATKDPWIPAERAHLLDLAKEKMTGFDFLYFKQCMKEFEKRAKEQGLSPWEVAQTYKQIARILESDNKEPTSPEQRVKIAQQVMSQAADPTSIDQGAHKTCSVTTIESRIYTKHPSAAAKLVADVSTTGTYMAPDGTQVKLPPECLNPDPDAREENPIDGERSYASQLFQVTAVNLWYAKENASTIPPGGKVYWQVEPKSGSKPPDTGEILFDPSTFPPSISDHPGLQDDHIVAINNMIVGEVETDVFLEHEDFVVGKGKDISSISSEEQLNDKLALLKSQGKLPVIVAVHTDNEPFFSDSGGNAAGGSGGGHVVTITDYHPGPPATVAIDNQWGQDVDHFGTNEVKLHDLYLAMRPATHEATLAELEKDVKWNKEHNQVDASVELQLLRLKHKKTENVASDFGATAVNDAIYDEKIVAKVLETMKRWELEKKDGTFNEKEHDKAIELLNYIIKEMAPKSRQKEIIEALKKELPDNKDIKQLEKKMLTRLEKDKPKADSAASDDANDLE